MATSDADRWWFLLTLSSLPVACGEVVVITPEETSGDSTTGSPMTVESSSSGEGVTTIVTTSLDGTSSSDVDSSTTVVDDTSSSGGSSSSTTLPIDPSTSESSSTTGEAPGLCELWAMEWVGCYGYYTVPYMTMYCYSQLDYTLPECLMAFGAVIQCEAFGGGPCVANCDVEEEAEQVCELGCDMIAMVPAVGTIEAQCTSLAMQATACHAAGYYIIGFSQYLDYPIDVMIDFCVDGMYVLFSPPSLAVGDTCGGAYEELLTCLSGVSCMELEFAAFDAFGGVCGTQYDGVECRCELGA